MSEKQNNRCLLNVVTLIILTLGAAHSAEKSADGIKSDWPQWRGPNRDGVSLETGLLKSWPENGPRVVWRIPAGTGFSGVSVSKGRLYTMWDQEDSQYLVCIDALIGKELWRHRLGPAYFNGYGDGPRASPVVDADMVFTISAQGNLYALAREDGRLIWMHDLEKEYQAKPPAYGYASSPIVVGERLFAETGGKNGTFMAFDKKSGELVWGTEEDIPAYSSPIVMSVAGVEQIVFWSATGVHALGGSDGQLIWKFPWLTLCPATGVPLNTATPILAGADKIFISSGSGGVLFQVTKEKGRFNTQTIWQSRNMKNTVNSSVIFEHHIYGFDGGILKCVDARTGEIKWRARGFQRGSLIVADGHLIVLGEQGRLALVEADPSRYIEKGQVQILNGRSWTSPTLAMGKLYLRNQKELVCLDLVDRAN